MQSKALIFIIVISIIIGAGTLTRGHIWGDDFASYIMQAESITSGNMDEFVTHNSFTIFESSNQIGPVAYPWGYPLILTPAYALKGNHPLALKLPGLFFYAGFLVGCFMLARTRLNSIESLVFTGLFAFNPLMLQFLDMIASDIPFLFFSTLALFIMVREQKQSTGQHVVLGIVIASAFFIRTTGLLLLVSFLAMQLIQLWKKRTESAALKQIVRTSWIVAGTFGLLWFLYVLVFPGGGESYFAQYGEFTIDKSMQLAGNYFQVFKLFFGEQGFWQILYIPLLILFLLGLWTRRQEDLLLILFFALWMIVLITWPFWQGPRFIFPLLPIFIYFVITGMKFGLEKLPSKYTQAGQWAYYGFWFLVAVTFLVTSARNAYVNLQSGRSINGPYDKLSKEVYQYVQETTPDDSVLVFFKPRAMRLMTDRDSILSTDCGGILKGDYLILSRKVGKNQQVPPEEIAACAIPLNQVFKNDRFIVYEIQK